MKKLSSLVEGDHVGYGGGLECCVGLVASFPGGFECEECGSSVHLDSDGVVTYVELNED